MADFTVRPSDLGQPSVDPQQSRQFLSGKRPAQLVLGGPSDNEARSIPQR
jgi:hypothetical protein